MVVILLFAMAATPGNTVNIELHAGDHEMDDFCDPPLQSPPQSAETPVARGRARKRLAQRKRVRKNRLNTVT